MSLKMATTTEIVHADFQGHDITFRADGWFNATAAAQAFGKAPHDWLRLPETARYLDAMERKYGKISYLKTVRGHGGGTWLHPKLAVPFARWLDVDFAVWCDDKIDQLVRGGEDKARARHAAASSHKVMCEILRQSRLAAGKETRDVHYMNEAKLTNWSCGGDFAGANRDAMTVTQLDGLAANEIQNAVMIGSGLPYAERKGELGKLRLQAPEAKTFPSRRRIRLEHAA
jgi:hypothetical protein